MVLALKIYLIKIDATIFIVRQKGNSKIQAIIFGQEFLPKYFFRC